MKFVLAIASILALASCSGGNTQPVNEGCPLIMLAPPAVLYPTSSTLLANGDAFDIIVDYQYGQYPLALQAPGKPTVMTGPAIAPAPTPFPAGAATPGPGAAPVAYAVAAGSLQAGVQYSIVATLTYPGDCPTQMPTLGTLNTLPPP